jgi:hypothetical protein
MNISMREWLVFGISGFVLSVLTGIMAATIERVMLGGAINDSQSRSNRIISVALSWLPLGLILKFGPELSMYELIALDVGCILTGCAAYAGLYTRMLK